MDIAGDSPSIPSQSAFFICPIIGDQLHEAESDPFGRICLHATSLEFLHPATDEPVRFESQPPFAKI